MHLSIAAAIAPEMLDLQTCFTAIQLYTRRLSPAPGSKGAFPFLRCEWLNLNVHHCLQV